MKAIQDFYPEEFAHCYGCGRANGQGLHLKSYIDGNETVARFKPAEIYSGGYPGHVYGGMIASLLDCHGTAWPLLSHTVSGASRWAKGKSRSVS